MRGVAALLGVVLGLALYVSTVPDRVGHCADPVPQAALQWLPTLQADAAELFPGFAAPEMFAGQVEQETCRSLTHKMCWNPRAELKTSREYGFGLGQITRTAQFDNFEAIKKMDAKLKTWAWVDRFDGRRQLRALVVYDAHIFRSVRRMARDDLQGAAFMFCAYNGGLGGLQRDRAICAKTASCDPQVWFGNVEHHSFRAKKAQAEYSKSFFQINREYVHNVVNVRSEKYRRLMQ